ncbi:MAG: acylphosphatase [Candidatus Aenigmatarchaeota archaeon]
MIQRVRIMISGDVQGVGFRQFIYKYAIELRLSDGLKT